MNDVYTLVIIDKNKNVTLKSFATIEALFEAKRYFMKGYSKAEIKQIDRDGFVLSVEEEVEE